jgi:hypothetical protein
MELVAAVVVEAAARARAQTAATTPHHEVRGERRGEEWDGAIAVEGGW